MARDREKKMVIDQKKGVTARSALRLRVWGAFPHNLSVLARAILTSIALSFNTLVIT
jgi:hypothetical protein